MAEQLVSLLISALRDLPGEALSIGAVVDDHLELVCRGRVAGTAVNERTVFYGASVAKQLIGVAVARAVSEAALIIDDSIVRWLPELPAHLEPIRLGHLLHHTSGLPDLTDPALGVPASNADVVDRFRHLDAWNREPGAQFAYNNAGYVLLAEALARSRHQLIEEILAELVMPLGLPDTRFGGPVVRLDGRPDPPGTVGDGGLWTSILDVTRWLQACNDARFGAITHQLAESTTSLNEGSAVNYAWGVRVAPSAAGRVVTHGGSWDSWLAKTVRIPERRIAVAVLSVGAAQPDVSRTGTELAAAIASR